MKNLLSLFLLFLTLSVNAQNERSQKEAVRNTQQPAPVTSQVTPRAEYNQKQDVRTYNEFQQQPRQNVWTAPNRTPNPNVIGWNTPFYYSNRWNSWGAPIYGYDHWMPGYYYDRWGYRNPYRAYHYEDGKVDTIRGKATRVSFGIQGSNKIAGGWITIGNKGYFIADYSQFIQNDESTYYPYLTMDKVIPWNDQKLEDLISGNAFYLGAGRRIGRTGIHAMLGFAHEVKKLQFFDEYYVLSNNGKYSILSSDQRFIGVKYGIIHDFKRVSLKIDYEAVRKRIYLGIGVNL